MTSTTNVQRRHSLSSSIKSFHEDLKTAYGTYFAPGFSRRASVESTPGATSSATSQTPHPTNLGKAWKALRKSQEDMNAAYEATYAPGRSSSASQTNPALGSPGRSVTPETHEEEAQKPKSYEKLWKRVKTAAMRHHRSVQAEVDEMYGMGTATGSARAEVNPCKSLPAGI